MQVPQPSSASGPPGDMDVLCFSHLRWDFVYQRPQHLLSRFSQQHRVFFVEEPIFDSDSPRLEIRKREAGLHVAVPHLPHETSSDDALRVQRELLDAMMSEHRIKQYLVWCYAPLSIQYWNHLQPMLTVYDCMDELSLFKNAPPELRPCEQRLFEVADLVFTGGQSLYEAKREQHSRVHAFPSSIDAKHFGKARQPLPEPADQATIPYPRLGFFGVVDERFDRELLKAIANRRPDWHFVILGPVVKIDPAELPQSDNIHYLGQKSYAELPTYIAHWDVALLLFARNDATRFISPTKTPEYLAAGKPVVSTSIRDVVRPYGDRKLVTIADEPEDFIRSIECALTQRNDAAWLQQVDTFLATTSWDRTYAAMKQKIAERLEAKSQQSLAESVAAD